MPIVNTSKPVSVSFHPDIGPKERNAPKARLSENVRFTINRSPRVLRLESRCTALSTEEEQEEQRRIWTEGELNPHNPQLPNGQLARGLIYPEELREKLAQLQIETSCTVFRMYYLVSSSIVAILRYTLQLSRPYFFNQAFAKMQIM